MITGYSLVIQSPNSSWKIIINDTVIVKAIKNNTININDFLEVVSGRDKSKWDIIIYRDMVALKVPTEKKIFIYTKKFWDLRCKNNLQNLKVLYFTDTRQY
ncbi:MAG: hypothetical protein RR620_08625 [Clostridium sp.]